MKKLILICLFSTFTLFAQSDFDLNYINDYRRIFTIQPIVYPTQEGDSIEIFVPFRFSLNYLTFEKNSKDYALFATSLLDLVFRDSSGVIRKSVNRVDTFFISNMAKDSINTRVFVDFFKVRLPFQNYFVELSLFDKGKIKVRTISKSVKIFKFGSLYIFQPIFCSLSKNNPDGYRLSLNGESLDFREPNKRIIIPLFSKDKMVKITGEIKSLDEQTYSMQWKKPITFQISPQIISIKPFNVVIKRDNLEIQFEQKTYSAENSSLFFFIIEFPEGFAYLQKYSLKLFSKDLVNDTVKFEFGISWDNPPISLRNIRYAIDIMYYIISDEEYKQILEKRKDELWTAFFDLWKKFDKEPSTKFIETMEEYYRRVDYCYFNFQTIYEQDGARTDRGKIFILYGKPSYVNRDMDLNGIVTETWVYYRFKKKFVFVSKNNKFELKEILNI